MNLSIDEGLGEDEKFPSKEKNAEQENLVDSLAGYFITGTCDRIQQLTESEMRLALIIQQKACKKKILNIP